ncbi:MAG: hypothetical protein IT364_17060 [Candidatus Hydrogenedentes bacterium]|nr:hypothetical protein [Candidatus Hydrogenedentota bacterium]
MGAEPCRRCNAKLLCAFVSILSLPAVLQSKADQDTTSIPTTNPSSNPQHLWVVGDSLYFSADDGLHGRELWRSDGEGHCSLAIDLNPGAASSNPNSLFEAAGWFYFVAEAKKGYPALWMWDPRTETVKKVLNPDSGESFHNSEPRGVLADSLCFTANTSSGSRQIWMTVLGFPERTRIADFGECPNTYKGQYPNIGSNGLMMYTAQDKTWCTNGTPAGSTLLQDINPSKPDDVSIWFGCIGERTVFVVDDGVHGSEPWITDGTSGGAHLLRDIAPGVQSSAISWMHGHEDVLLLVADDGEHGLELWRTDGTEEGTQMICDIFPGRSGGNPHYFSKAGRWSYFAADDGVHGKELWRTDGTSEGTSLVKDAHPGVNSSNPYAMWAADDKLFFCCTTPDFGDEIWVSDGTEEGTHLFKDINPGNAAGGPNQLRWLKGRLFFTYDDPFFGEELWISDGTPEGTRMAEDIHPPRYNPGSHPRSLTAFGERLVFAVADMGHGEEPWISDGTEEGSRLLADISPGQSGSEPKEFTVAKDHLYFSAHTAVEGRELWITDGTSEGTRIVADLAEGPLSSDPTNLVSIEHEVYFIASDGRDARLLWRCDGTATGTKSLEVGSIQPGSINVTKLFIWRDQLFLYTKEGNDKAGLWRIRSDGEPEQLARGSLDAMARDLKRPGNRENLECAPENEEVVALVLASEPVASNDQSTQSANLGNVTYFVAHTRQSGAELWSTDGSLAGTRLVCDAFPGPASSSPASLTKVGELLYFVADHPREGRVLWRTDGTSNGTAFVKPILSSGTPWISLHVSSMASLGASLVVACPTFAVSTLVQVDLNLIEQRGTQEIFRDLRGGRSELKRSWPRQLTTVGEQVFFTANDGIHGEELWVTDGTPDPPRLVKDILVPGDLTPLRR